jgi:L-lactate permease
MRSLVKRLGMGLPNNLLPEFPAITGSLIDRSIDCCSLFLKYAWQPMQSLTESIDQSASRLIY